MSDPASRGLSWSKQWLCMGDDQAMEKVEAVRVALAELGAASDEAVSAFVQDRHGVVVNPKFVPVLRAMLKEREMMAAFRQKQAAERSSAAAVAAHPPQPPA
jgi:hypothetical protein